LKKVLKTSEKCLTNENRLWYNEQAVARKGNIKTKEFKKLQKVLKNL
jgi:hypothetical protein